MGKPIHADERITMMQRITYTRMLIEIDVTQIMPKQVLACDPDGREFSPKVEAN